MPDDNSNDPTIARFRAGYDNFIKHRERLELAYRLGSANRRVMEQLAAFCDHMDEYSRKHTRAETAEAKAELKKLSHDYLNLEALFNEVDLKRE